MHVRYVDLSIELQVLGFYRARQDAVTRAGGTGDERVPLIRAVGMSRSSRPGLTRGRSGPRRVGTAGRPGPAELCSDPGGIRVSVVVIGLQHTQAPLPLLEATAVVDADLHKTLSGAQPSAQRPGGVVLSTCLRTEVYAVVDRFHDAVAEIYGVLSDALGRVGRGAVARTPSSASTTTSRRTSSPWRRASSPW